MPVSALTLARLLPLLVLLDIEVASRRELSPFLEAVVIRYGWDVSSRRHVVDFCVEISVEQRVFYTISRVPLGHNDVLSVILQVSRSSTGGFQTMH